MSTINTMLAWAGAHSLLISGIALLSLGLLAMTILATPWLVSRLPEDYLLNRRIAKLARGPIPLLILTLRGVVGLVMVALGIVMMVTPGPGIVMLLLGVSVAEFPGKHRLLLYIGTRPRVFASLNWMRERHNKPPLRYPHAS